MFDDAFAAVHQTVVHTGLVEKKHSHSQVEEQKRKLLSLGKKLKGQLRTKKLTLKQAEKNLNLLEADIAKAMLSSELLP